MGAAVQVNTLHDLWKNTFCSLENLFVWRTECICPEMMQSSDLQQVLHHLLKPHGWDVHGTLQSTLHDHLSQSPWTFHTAVCFHALVVIASTEGCQKRGKYGLLPYPPRPRNPRMVFFPEKMLPTFFLSEIRPLMGEQNIHLVPIQKILFFDPGILFPRIRARQGFFQSCPNGCRHDKGTPESRPSVKHVWGCRFL